MERLETKSVNCRIANVLDSGVAFAVVEGSDEEVYINSVARRLSRVQWGDYVKCDVIPNSKQPTPEWFAVRVVKVKEPTPQPTEEIGVKDVVACVMAGEVMTTSEVAETLNIPRPLALTLLNAAHNAGEVHRIEGFRKGGQKRASYIMWVYDMEKIWE